MKGLLVKDMCLLFQRKQTMVLFIALAVIMGYVVSGSLMVGFVTLLCTMLAAGSISYDEFDNGYPFLMSLPIERKTYAKEKYIFCLLGSAIGWIFAAIVFIATSLLKGYPVEYIAIMLPVLSVFIPMFIMTIGLMVPLQLKYGSERSRTVLIAICGGIAVVFFLIKQLLELIGIDAEMLMENAAVSGPVMLMVMVVVFIGVMGVSYWRSLVIMEKKEF